MIFPRSFKSLRCGSLVLSLLGGVVVQPSTDPSNWAYDGVLGVDNPDFDKVEQKIR